MHVGLREANQRFANAVRVVRSGREVVLTDRGKPIAVIRPIANVEDDEQALQRLADDGLIRRAKHPGPMPAARWTPAKVHGPSLTDAVLEDREESA